MEIIVAHLLFGAIVAIRPLCELVEKRANWSLLLSTAMILVISWPVVLISRAIEKK